MVGVAVIAHALAAGKTLAVPKVDLCRKRMDAVRLPSIDALVPGAYGTVAPDATILDVLFIK